MYGSLRKENKIVFEAKIIDLIFFILISILSIISILFLMYSIFPKRSELFNKINKLLDNKENTNIYNTIHNGSGIIIQVPNKKNPNINNDLLVYVVDNFNRKIPCEIYVNYVYLNQLPGIEKEEIGIKAYQIYLKLLNQNKRIDTKHKQQMNLIGAGK